MSKSDALVVLSNLRKSYDGRFNAVEDLNLEIRRGEFVSLLGPSGSGKTSTLMMLAGFETPSSGDIRMDGASVTTVPPHQRGIGIVFQNYALFPHMTIGNNVAYPLRARGVAKHHVARKVSEALAMVKLSDFMNRYPKTMSGGQQQRAALARALVFDPSLVLMDEPLGALDRQLREHMLVEIKRIHKELAVTIVYVTHDQGEALALSDRIAIFNRGRIEQLGTPEEIYERPASAFVAGFVGENNHIRGRVEKVDGDICLVSTVDGKVIKGMPVGSLMVGGAAIVSVRPDRISAGTPDQGAENVFICKVDQSTYRGDSICFSVEYGGDADFSVRTASRGVSTTPSGSDLEISWRAADTLVFPAE